MKIIGILLGPIKKIMAMFGRSSGSNNAPEKTDGPGEIEEPVAKEAVEKEDTSETEASADQASIVEDDEKDGQLAEGVIISEDTDSPEEQPEGGESLEGLDEGFDKKTEGSDEGVVPQDHNEKGVSNTNLFHKWHAIAAKNRYTFGGLAAGIFVLVTLNVTNIMDRPSVVEETPLAPVHIFLASIEGKISEIFYFDRFLILLADEDQAYISLDVAVTPSSKSVFGEMKAKRTICRSVIYNVLKEAVTKKHGSLESIEKLQKDILKALNSVLVNGTVEAVDFSGIYAV